MRSCDLRAVCMMSSVERWLHSFLCSQYAHIFEAYGYKSLHSVCSLQLPHLLAMGVPRDHCEKILDNLHNLRQTMFGHIPKPTDSDLYHYNKYNPSRNPAVCALKTVAMNANYRGMSQYPDEYSAYSQSGNNMQAVGFHQGSYESANMAMMNPMGGGGAGSYPLAGYDSSQSHLMMGGQGQMAHPAMYPQQAQQQAAFMAQQQQQQQQQQYYSSGSGSGGGGGSSGGQYRGQTYPVQGAGTMAGAAAMGGSSPYYSTGGAQGQGQGQGSAGPRMVPPPHHHLRNTSGQQNPQQVADNILQIASSFPSHHTVQVPLKNRHAPYQIPRSPQNYYAEKCGGQQQGLGSQGPKQAMHNPQTLMGQQAVAGGQLQTSQPQGQMGQPSTIPHSPAMMYAGSSPHSQIQQNSPSSPLMMQSPAAAHQSLSSPGALNSPSSAAVCSPVPSSPGLVNMRSPSSMPMRSPAHLSSGYPSQPISSPPQRPFPVSDSSGGTQHCSPTSMHSPASHNSSPYASAGMAHLVNSPPQQSHNYSAPNQSCCSMNMLMDSGQGPGGHRVQGGHGQDSDPLQSLQKLVMLPETQVVDPKSVVNDGCLQNCEDGSKNSEGPAEQSREAVDCSAGVSVNTSSPPTSDAPSASDNPPHDTSEEPLPTVQVPVSQSDLAANCGESIHTPAVTETLLTPVNESMCETPISQSPSDSQCNISKESDQTICSTSPQINSPCKSDAVSGPGSYAAAGGTSCQSEQVVSTTESETPHSDIESADQETCSKRNCSKKQNPVSSPTQNGPVTPADSSHLLSVAQLSDKSKSSGAGVESDSPKDAAEVIAGVSEGVKVKGDMQRAGNTSTNDTASKPSPPKKRHSQRLLTLAYKSAKSSSSLSAEDGGTHAQVEKKVDKKGVQSSDTTEPSSPKKRHSRRLPQSSGLKSASANFSAGKTTDLKGKKDSISGISETMVLETNNASKPKLVNGFDDEHTCHTESDDVIIVDKPEPRNHIHKRQTQSPDHCSKPHESPLKGGVWVTNDKADGILQSVGINFVDTVRGLENRVTSCEKTEGEGRKTDLSGQTQSSSSSVLGTTSISTACVLNTVSTASHYPLSGEDDDSFSSDLDFGYDSPPFEMQEDSWKPDPDNDGPTSSEDEADGNGNGADKEPVKKNNQSTHRCINSSLSKATPLVATRTVTRSITGRIPPKRRTEEIEYTTDFKRTKRTPVVFEQPSSVSLSMECEEIDTKGSLSDVEVISSSDESHSDQGTQVRSSPGVHLPVNNDAKKQAQVVVLGNVSSPRDGKDGGKNQNMRAKSKDRKHTANFYSVRGAGGRFISRRQAGMSCSSVTSSVNDDASTQLLRVVQQQNCKEEKTDSCALLVKETRNRRYRSEQQSVSLVTDTSCGVTSTVNKPKHSLITISSKSCHVSSPPRSDPLRERETSGSYECEPDKSSSEKKDQVGPFLQYLPDRKSASRKSEVRAVHESVPDRKDVSQNSEVRKDTSQNNEVRPHRVFLPDRRCSVKKGEVQAAQVYLPDQKGTVKEEDRPGQGLLSDRKGDEVKPLQECFPRGAVKKDDLVPSDECSSDKKYTSRNNEDRSVCSDSNGASRKEEIRSISKQKTKKQVRGKASQNRFFELDSVDDSFKNMKFSKTLDHLQHNKKEKSQSGKVFTPFVRVQGKRSTPANVSVFNAPPVDGKNSKSTNKSKGALGTTGATTTVPITNFSSDKSVMLPWTKTTEAPWVCALCGKRSSYRFLGDLFGPYFVESHLSTLMKGAGEGSKKDSRHDSAGPLDPQNPHNTRRRSLSQNRTTSTEETTSAPQELWVHEDCVLWSTGVYVVGTCLYGLEEALTATSATMCACCQEKGALIGCLHKGCNQNFHYICAVDKMCFLDVENFSMLCPKHKDKRMKSVSASTSKS